MSLHRLIVLFLPLAIALGVLIVTIYEHVVATALSLPFAPGVSAVTIALPPAAAANAVFLARWRRGRVDGVVNSYRSPVQSFLCGLRLPPLAAVLQTLQAVVTVAAATLYLAVLADTTGPLRCALESVWQRHFSAHDADALRRVQDALQCCGFNSIADRAWPFAPGTGPGTCAQSYGRTTACRGPWIQTARQRAGVELAMVLLVAVVQAATVLGWWGVPDAAAVFSAENGHYADEDDHSPARRPLLEARASISGPTVAEELDSDGEEAGGRAIGHGNGAGNGAGGPRLEPSGLHNEWTA